MSLLEGEALRVIDTETTGFFPEAHRIIEIASVRLEDGAVGEGWSSFVQPGRRVPAEATAVHGITAEMLKDAPSAAEVAAALRAEIGDRPLVFHNARFDLMFVRRLLAEGGQPPLGAPVIDTLGLARGLDPSGGHSLGRLTERYGVPRQERHRALPDATSTAMLLLVLAERWESRHGVRSLMELAAASQDALRRVPPETMAAAAAGV